MVSVFDEADCTTGFVGEMKHIKSHNNEIRRKSQET